MNPTSRFTFSAHLTTRYASSTRRLVSQGLNCVRSRKSWLDNLPVEVTTQSPRSFCRTVEGTRRMLRIAFGRLLGSVGYETRLYASAEEFIETSRTDEPGADYGC
jgi:hypothetical protein